MNKVYYKFEDGVKTYSLSEAKNHKKEIDEDWEVGYEFIPMPVDACEGGNIYGRISAEFITSKG